MERDRERDRERERQGEEGGGGDKIYMQYDDCVIQTVFLSNSG